MQITAEVTKITKNVRYDLNFIFTELSETIKSLVKIRLVLEINNVVNFLKPRFY